MKSKQRHQLKENDLVHTINSVREYVEPRQRQVTGVVAIVIVLAVAVAGVMAVRGRLQNRGAQSLADAMVALNARVVPAAQQGPEGDLPAAAGIGATGTFSTEEAKLNAALPKLRTAANEYPDTNAGITARYHLAGALASLGRYPDAIKEFDQVAQKSGSGTLYGRMARLGKADAEVRAGQLDQAITTYKELAAQPDSDIPVEAILIELARAYVAKGNTEEARKTFTQVVDQHPDSPYSQEARQELESLKS